MQPLGTPWGEYKVGSPSLCGMFDVGGVLVGKHGDVEGQKQGKQATKSFLDTAVVRGDE
jgi:hypothetical protein